MIEKFRYLAAVIAAHPDRQVVGRTRLQKTVKLLQRIGVPMDYDYMIHFYGPYSEGLQSDIGLLEQLGLLEENERQGKGGPYFILQATDDVRKLADADEVAQFQPAIDIMSGTDAVILELAATYDAFRELGDDHDKATMRVRRKKGPKCDEGRLALAMTLLGKLGLSAA